MRRVVKKIHSAFMSIVEKTDGKMRVWCARYPYAGFPRSDMWVSPSFILTWQVVAHCFGDNAADELNSNERGEA